MRPRAKQPCRRERRCQSLGWAAARGALRGAPGAAAAWPGAGRIRWGGRRALPCLPRAKWPGAGCWGSRTSRSGAALRSCPAGRAGVHLLGHSPGGLRPPAWRSPPGLAPLKAKTKPPRPTGAPRPGRRGVRGAPVPHSARPTSWPARQGPARWATGTRALGALTLRELLCYLEDVNVF